jgi:hypothetical protein
MAQRLLSTDFPLNQMFGFKQFFKQLMYCHILLPFSDNAECNDQQLIRHVGNPRRWAPVFFHHTTLISKHECWITTCPWWRWDASVTACQFYFSPLLTHSVCNMVGKNIRNYIQYFSTWCCFPYVYFCELSLSCVYCFHLMCICCTLCVFVVLMCICSTVCVLLLLL